TCRGPGRDCAIIWPAHEAVAVSGGVSLARYLFGWASCLGLLMALSGCSAGSDARPTVMALATSTAATGVLTAIGRTPIPSPIPSAAVSPGPAALPTIGTPSIPTPAASDARFRVDEALALLDDDISGSDCD